MPADVTHKKRPLNGLLNGISNNSITDIETVIELGRSNLASSDPSDLHSSDVFCEILFEAFECTKGIKYLNESIQTRRRILARRPPKLPRLFIVDEHLLSFDHPLRDISRTLFARSARNDRTTSPRFSTMLVSVWACRINSILRAYGHFLPEIIYSVRDCVVNDDGLITSNCRRGNTSHSCSRYRRHKSPR